jgi:hypothetical protein
MKLFFEYKKKLFSFFPVNENKRFFHISCTINSTLPFLFSFSFFLFFWKWNYCQGHKRFSQEKYRYKSFIKHRPSMTQLPTITLLLLCVTYYYFIYLILLCVTFTLLTFHYLVLQNYYIVLPFITLYYLLLLCINYGYFVILIITL